MLRSTQIAAAAAVLLFAVSTAASGQASRTWVSGVGDDANPCSRTAPCKTFAGAISKTAAQGEISVLDPGGFGAVTITKSITIDGNGQLAGILAAGVNGIIINAAATDNVTIRNLSIEGFNTGLNGIRVLAAGAVHIDNVRIERFTGFGISLEPGATTQITIADSRIAYCGGAAAGGGVQLVPGAAGAGNLALTRTIMDRNRTGLLIDNRGKAVVRDSVVSASTTHGFHVRGTTAAAEMTLLGCTASGNALGGIRSEGALAVARLSNTTATGNNTGVFSAAGGAILSFGNNQNSGNVTNNAPTGAIALQ